MSRAFVVPKIGKHGDERTLSLYWFVMFVILTIAVVSGVALFYGRGFDVRVAEATLLADSVTHCVVHDGILDTNLFSEQKSIEQACELVFADASFSSYAGHPQYYVSVQSDTGTLTAGNKDAGWEAFCGHEGSLKNIPACVKRTLVVLERSEKGERFVPVNIVSIVAKMEQNAHG